MGTRHWYNIIYREGNRDKIALLKRDDESSISIDNFLASRREFEWWDYTRDEIDADNSIVYDLEAQSKAEKEAANYARKLAAKHDLIFVGQSKTDGILD